MPNPPNQVYFASNIPPASGSGTVDDPYSADQFDSILNALTKWSPVASPLDIYLGPGTYDTYGVYFPWGGSSPYNVNQGFNINDGWRFLGSGQGVTIIRLATLRQVSAAQFTNAVFLTWPNVKDVEIRDLTVDCNFPTLGGTLTTLPFTQPSGTTPVTVTVSDTSKFVLNCYVVIQSNSTTNATQIGTYKVIGITAPNTLILENLAHLGGGKLDVGVPAGPPAVPAGQMVCLYASVAGILLDASSSRVENVHIKNAASTIFESPFLLFHAASSTIHSENIARSVTVDNTWGIWGTAIQINGDGGATANASIEDCIISGNGYTQHALTGNGTTGSRFVNNNVTGCLHAFYSDYTPIDGLILAGNIFSGFPPDQPLRQNSPQYMDVAAVKIGSLESSFKNMILSNNIIRLTAPTSEFVPYGFYLWRNVDMTTVQGNIVSGTSGVGIRIDGEATNVLVSDNLISPALTTSISPKSGMYLTIPSGLILPYAGSSTTPPEGWLFPFGQPLSINDYPGLFAAFGYTYGGSAGTFYLPDLRGRVAVGKDDMGGVVSSPPRITTADCGINGTQLGQAGGAQSIVLGTGEIPSHTHGITFPNNAYGWSFPLQNNTVTTGGGQRVVNVSTATPPSATNANTPNGAAHRNVQPSIISNWIIKI